MSTASIPILNGPAVDPPPPRSARAPAAPARPAEPLLELETETVLVTPTLATRWLHERHPNRRLKPPRVAELAQLMRHGQWHLNGEPLIFARDGRLVDGQNRLAALIEAGLTLPFLVVRGVDLAVQPTLCHYVMHQKDPVLAKTFFKRLRDGLELTERDPIYGLRKRCQEARLRQPKPPPWVYAFWAIQSWNALRQGRGAPQLLWSPEVEEARFPEVL